MFSTLSGGRRYPGSLAHRHKNVTFGKIAIGVAKGTAMIVIGVPVCTIAAGLGATAIVAYGLASPFYYGGKKLVRKIQRHSVQKKEELAAECCPDRLTREDILIWLENCEESDYYSAQADDTPLTGGGDCSVGASTSESSETPAGATGGRRKRPALKRLFSRESRVLIRQSDADEKDQKLEQCGSHQQQPQAVQKSSSQQQQPLQLLHHHQRQRRHQQQYSELISETTDSGEETEQADLWREMETVVSRLREDRLSICPENVVTMEQPLLLTDGKDVLQFIQQLQLDGHLGQLTKASSLPNLVSTSQSPSVEESLDKLTSLPGQQQAQQQQQHGAQQQYSETQETQRRSRYKRTVSEGCGLAQRQKVALEAK